MTLSPEAARRALLLLTFTRWFPVGLVVSAVTLLPLERGLSVTQTLALATVTGLVVATLELPTAGIADSAGRRPVLLTGAVLQVAAATLYCVAPSFWVFAAGAVAMGVFRALDSGPLEAWFVDTVHANRPGADVDRTLARQGTVLGASIAAGALVSGGLVWWHPVAAWSALTLPYVCYAALAVVHLVMVAVLLKEPRRSDAIGSPARPAAEPVSSGTPGSTVEPPPGPRPVAASVSPEFPPAVLGPLLSPQQDGASTSLDAPPPAPEPLLDPRQVATSTSFEAPRSASSAPSRPLRRAVASARRAPAVVVSGLHLAATNPVLRALLLVEVFWSTAMVVFESFAPIRMGELLGSTTRAGAVMGPVACVGWATFALGSTLAGLASGRLGVARTALLARLLNGLGAVWMGLATGPAGLVAAYLVTYGLHGSGGPVYNTLLHREASAANRTTVLSLASMVGFLTYSAASPLLGWTADAISTPVAMVAGGAFSVFGVLCFLPAVRRERDLRATVRVAPGL